MKGRIVVVGMLVILLFSSFAVGFVSGNVVKKRNTIGVKGYTPHNVIRINSNADFANQATSEGWLGNGTESDPYIISGYEIDAHGVGNAIYIGNTTLYFIVENCYLHNASYHSDPYFDGDGITLYNVMNGKISGNNITTNGGGIYSDYSSSNAISGNTITNNWDGIYLGSSHSNTISENNITNNGWDGIYLYHSSSNTISRNNITNNGDDGIYLDSSSSNTISGDNITNSRYNGIFLYSSSNNTISGNTLPNNGWNGIDMRYSNNNTIRGNRMVGGSIMLEGNEDTFTTQNITRNNTVNGKPVYYYKNVNMNNATVPLDAGEVILGNVTWLKIDDMNLLNGFVSIVMGYSSHITISGNNITNNSWDGIYLYHSNSNTISRNKITNNSGDGVYLDSSSSNIISGNNIRNNGDDGIYLSSSNNNTITGNNITNNKMGIYLVSSINSNISANNISSNSGSGIRFISSSNNTIRGNNILWNQNYGIRISGSHNLIYNNSFYYNHGSNGTYNSSRIQAYDDGSNNYWNSTTGIGNYWYDWANNNDTNDQNHDGIVDWPYKIAGSAGAKDYYPLKNGSEIPEFSVGIWILILIIISLLETIKLRKFS